MANLPPPLNLKAAPFEASSSSVAAAAAANKDRRMQSAEQLVLDLCNPDFRENALLELSKVFRCFSLFLSFRVFHALKGGLVVNFFWDLSSMLICKCSRKIEFGQFDILIISIYV